MKRIGCLLLALMMVIGMTGCASTGRGTGRREPAQPEAGLPGAQSAQLDTVSGSADPLLNTFMKDWLNLLLLQEERYAQENYTLEYILKIGEKPSWENYVYARTACGYTCKMMELLSQNPIVPAMTEADYEKLIDMGMDVGDVQTEYQIYNEITVPDLKDVDHVIWSDYYQMNLLYACYDRDTMEILMDSAQTRISVNEDNLKYWYLVTNFIMLELPKEEGQWLMETAEANAPHVMSQYPNPLKTTTGVFNEMSRVLDHQEENLKKQQTITTKWDLLLEDTNFKVQKISGLPQVVLFPESVSVDDWEVQYYWKEGDQIRTAEYLLEMKSVPNCMYMTKDDTTLEAYQGYVLELRDSGLTPSDMNETAAMYELDNGAVLTVMYKDCVITVSVTGGQVCFAPRWYMDAL